MSPQPSDFRDYFLDKTPPHIPPLFKIPYLNGIVPNYRFFGRITVASWYFGTAYFDIYRDSKLQRFEIIIKPDLSDASLHLVNIPEIFGKNDFNFRGCEEYGIRGDALVFFWNNRETWGTFTGLTSAPSTNVMKRWTRNVSGHRKVKSLCPASGRFAYFEDGDHDGTLFRRIVVVDLF